MFDSAMRKVVDPPVALIAGFVVRAGIGANTVTLAGLIPGFGAAVAISQGAFWLGLVLIAVNRILDGLDGAVARRWGATDLGGYLDIVSDFLFYGAIPFAFALYDPAMLALPACFLLLSFIGTGSSFLAFATIAEKRGVSTDIRGKKSFYYLGGLTEGTETIAFFVLCCLFPEQFATMAWIFGTLCWITTITRVLAAFSVFKEEGSKGN